MIDKEITAKLQKVELEMLIEIKELFDKNNIPFFLACGTFLGAVRHSGFIPWDDDVDIYCFAKDLSRINKCLSQSKNISYCDGLTQKRYPYWFPKIIKKNTVLEEESVVNSDFKCGVYIDIFPLVDLPESDKLRRKLEKKRYFYYGLLKCKFIKPIGLKRKILHFFSFFVSSKFVNKKLYGLYQKEIKNSSFVIDAGTFRQQAVLNKKWFESAQSFKFCNHYFPGSPFYDEYLTHFYGNYMQLPPPEKRFSNHTSVYIEIDGVVYKDVRKK